MAVVPQEQGRGLLLKWLHRRVFDKQDFRRLDSEPEKKTCFSGKWEVVHCWGETSFQMRAKSFPTFAPSAPIYQSEPSHVCCSVSWSFLIAMGTWPRSHTQYQPQWKRSANPLLDMYYTSFSNRPAIFLCRKMAGWKLPSKIVCPGLQSLQLMKILTTAMQALRQAQKMHFLSIHTHPGSKIHTLTKIMWSTNWYLY